LSVRANYPPLCSETSSISGPRTKDAYISTITIWLNHRKLNKRKDGIPNSVIPRRERTAEINSVPFPPILFLFVLPAPEREHKRET